MADDSTNNNDPNRSMAGQERTTADAWSREEWESLESDPDYSDDFEYEQSEWEQFETLDGTDQIMFLPNDEAELREAAFVVAEEESLVNLANHC